MNDATITRQYETFEFDWCTDCLCMDANGTLGDVTEEEDAAHAAAMEREWPQADGWHTHNNCDGDCEGSFSWVQCEGCGSTLGGDRHPAMAMKEIPLDNGNATR